MKKLIKTLLLGALTIGMATGCEWGKSSNSTTGSESSSSNSSESSSTISTSTPSSESTTSSVAPTLVSISLNTTNVKKTYNYGEALDLTGLVVNANYSNNTFLAVTDYTTNPANGTVLNEVGNVNITVSYQNLSEQFSIVVNKSLTGITLNTELVKKEYVQGEALDLTGLVVTANFDNNSTEVVTNYTTNPANGATLETIGNQNVVVTYSNKTAEFVVTVSKAPKAAWTDEEAAIMSSHLYGEVLPFTGFEESEVSYNSEYGAVVIVGGTVGENTLLDYSRALAYNSFVLISNSSLVFQKKVTTAQGNRFVRVELGKDKNDTLMVIAYDPFVYSFPTIFAEEVANKYFSSEYGVPAIVADYYQIIESSSMLAIYCYLESTTEDAGYSAILRDAGWAVQDEKQGAYFVAISPDNTYMIYYTYDADYGDLDIIFMPVNFWNSAAIEGFFEKYGADMAEVPAFVADGASFIFSESEYNDYFFETGALDMVVAFMEIYGAKLEDAQKYAETLQGVGYSVLTNGNSFSAKIAIEGKGMFRIDFSYDPETTVITVIFYIYLEPFAAAEFPQEEISELLGGYLIDTIPGYTEECNGYTLFDDSYGTYIQVDVEVGTEEAAIASYKETLEQSGYTLMYEGSTTWVSPNHEIYVQLYKQTGSFQIKFDRAPYLAWPSAQIAAYLGEGLKDSVPAFTDADADEFRFEIDEDGLWITVSYDYEEDENEDPIEYDMEEISNAYIETLENNGYFKLMEGEDGELYYVSKNFDIILIISYDDIWDEIYIMINTVAAATANDWPVYQLNYYFEKMGYVDELPVYDGELFLSQKTTVGSSYLTIDIALDTEDVDEMKAEADAYVAALEEAGFTFLLSLGEDNACRIYTSPNADYEVAVLYQPDGFTVQIDEIATDAIETDEFPGERLFTRYEGLKGVLPVVTDENAHFSTTYQTDFVEIFVTYENASYVASAMQAYIDALVEAGFKAEEENEYGYDVVYVSPDGSYYVAVTDWSDFETPGYDIEIFFD